MATKEVCLCVKGATEKAAYAALGITKDELLAKYWAMRDMLCDWYDVDNWLYLPEDVCQFLVGYWRLLKVPVDYTVHEVGYRPNPDCWCCNGTGEFDYTTWEEVS